MKISFQKWFDIYFAFRDCDIVNVYEWVVRCAVYGVRCTSGVCALVSLYYYLDWLILILILIWSIGGFCVASDCVVFRWNFLQSVTCTHILNDHHQTSNIKHQTDFGCIPQPSSSMFVVHFLLTFFFSSLFTFHCKFLISFTCKAYNQYGTKNENNEHSRNEKKTNNRW